MIGQRERRKQSEVESKKSCWNKLIGYERLISPSFICCLNYLCLDIFIMFTRCLQETLLDKIGRLGRLDYHSSHSLSYDFHYRLIPLFLQLTSSLFYLNISITGFIHWITFCQLMYLG